MRSTLTASRWLLIVSLPLAWTLTACSAATGYELVKVASETLCDNAGTTRPDCKNLNQRSHKDYEAERRKLKGDKAE